MLKVGDHILVCSSTDPLNGKRGIIRSVDKDCGGCRHKGKTCPGSIGLIIDGEEIPEDCYGYIKPDHFAIVLQNKFFRHKERLCLK